MNALVQEALGQAEEPFFFELGRDRLFAILHRAQKQPPKHGVVLCHALGEEKLWSHRVYVSLARQLARAGYAVLRFDCRGEGDSDLEFEDTGVETRVADTLQAVRELRSRVPGVQSVTVFGHRIGGSVAAAAFASDPREVQALAVWDPIVDGREYLMQMLRSNLTTQMAVHGKVLRDREALLRSMAGGEPVVVDGYPLTGRLLEELSALKWTASLGAGRPVFIAEVKKGEQTAPSPALLKALGNAANVHCVVSADPPVWRETRQFHKSAPAMTPELLEWLGRIGR